MSAPRSQSIAPATTFSRYLNVNGLMYFSSGMLFVVWPYAMELAGAPKLLAPEAGYLRLVGVLVMQIASFYLFGVRTGWEGFSLSTLFNRFLAPVEILPLVFMGLLEPMLGIPFTLTDVALATIGLVIWRRSGPTKGLLQQLFGPPAGPATRLSSYLSIMGASFLVIGLLFYFWPQWLLQSVQVDPHELGYLRAIGIATLQVGWFYTIGARTRSDSFAFWSMVLRAGSAAILGGLLAMNALRPEIAGPLLGVDILFLVAGAACWATRS